MLYSQSLLRRRISLHDTPEHIADELTLHTCEIEETIIRQIPELVVIGYVTDVSPHPDADKLVVCQVEC